VRNVALARRLVDAASLFAVKKYRETRDILIGSMSKLNSNWNPEMYYSDLFSAVAQTYAAEGNTPMAKHWYMRALHHADSLGYVNLQLNALAALSRLNISEVTDYRSQYLEKKDSVMSKGRLSMIGEIEFLNELKIERNKSKMLAEARDRLIKWIIAGVVIFCFIAVFVIIVVRQSIRLRQTNRNLYMRITAQLDSDKPIVTDMSDNSHSDTGSADQRQDGADKYRSSSLSDAHSEDIYNGILKVLSDPDTVCSREFSLSQLSSMLKENTSYVSRVINQKCGCSFSTLINDRRIKIACKRMCDTEHYGSMTIEAIANSVGFASRSSFVTAFKKINGMTPSEYLKLSRDMGA